MYFVEYAQFKSLQGGKELMYTHREIRPGVFAIEDGNVRMYLVCGSTRAVLLDTGYGTGDLRSYVKELYAGEILVAHTHTHMDHIGGDAAFERIYASEAEWDVLQAAGIVRAHLYPLRQGDVLELGGKSLSVHETPGHTACSLCFADRENRLLFTGDNVSDVTIYLCMPGADVALYARSLRWILNQAGHFDVFLGCHGRAEQYPADVERLLAGLDAIHAGWAVSEVCNAYGDCWFRKLSYGGASFFFPLREQP